MSESSNRSVCSPLVPPATRICCFSIMWPSTAAVLLGFLIFSYCPFSSAWHAWVGSEAVPTRAGTNLESFLELPALTGGLSNLSLPLTSLKKVTEGSKCAMSQDECSLECATAWGSFLRDTRPVVGTVAPSLKDALQAAFPGGFSEENPLVQPSPEDLAPLSNIEFAYLSQDMCRDAYNCAAQHCTPSAVVEPSEDGTSSSDDVASLRPNDCETFSVQHGPWTLPFLTWRAMHQDYIPQSLGSVGGLGLLADREHAVWACVSQPGCRQYARDDQACFKYSEVRGEFHFWGWNSQLGLAPPLFEVEVSFCDGRRLAVTNARTGLPVAIQDTTFSIQGGTTRALFSRGRDGCNAMLLRGGRYLQLSMMKPGFYPFSERYWIPRTAATLPVALFPIMSTRKKGSIGVSLSWCRRPADLNWWISLPFVTSRPFRACRATAVDAALGESPWKTQQEGIVGEEQCSASLGNAWVDIPAFPDQRQPLYWGGPRHAVSECPPGASGAACAAGEVFLEGDANAGYGPESLVLRGDLPTGTYSVFVHVNSDGGGFDTGCNHVLVTLYTELAGRSIRTFQAGMNTTGGAERGWWHVFNVRVDDGSEFGSVCTWLEEVDAAVPGYGAERPAAGEALESGAVKARRRVLCTVGAEAVEVRYLVFDVRDAISGERVSGATYEIRQGGAVQASGFVDGLPASGLELLAGEYQVSIGGRSDFLSQIVCVSVDQTVTRRSLYLTPLDQQTRVTLRWGGDISMLQLYVVPVGTRQTWASDAAFAPGSHPFAGGESAELRSGAARIALANSPAPHQHPSDLGANQPAAVELSGLPPGQYRVFVTAAPRDEAVPVIPAGGLCSEEVAVDVVIGGQRVTTVAFALAPVKWWYVGYFARVTEEAAELGWVTEARSLRDNPLLLPLTRVTLSIRDAVSFTPESDFSALAVEVYRESTSGQPVCSCVGAVSCICNGELVAVGSPGPDRLPCNPFGDGATACDDLKWEPEVWNALYITAGQYRVVLRQLGYIDRYLPMAVQSTDFVLSTTMVPLVPANSLRIVLMWEEVPNDVDLWVVSEDATDIVYWQRPDLDSALDDIRLDTDATLGFGPESIIFGPDAPSGMYRVAVNVYEQLEGQECSVVPCAFNGGEVVEFYDSNGLITGSIMPNDAGPSSRSWWLAATVQVSPSGFLVDNNVANTQNFDTECSAVFTPPGGRCLGTYCECECTSKCGQCPIGDESCPTYYAYYYYYEYGT